MVSNMKTTVNISDTLYEEARAAARARGTTIRVLIEEGLRHSLAEFNKPSTFKLRKASFKGTGLQRDFAGASWEQIRDASYEGRGG